MCNRCQGLFQCHPHWCDGRGLGEPTPAQPLNAPRPHAVRSGGGHASHPSSAAHKLCLEGVDEWQPRFDRQFGGD